MCLLIEERSFIGCRASPAFVGRVSNYFPICRQPGPGPRRAGPPRIGSCHVGHALLLYCGHRSEEHTSELQSQSNLVCRLLLEKKKKKEKSKKNQKKSKQQYKNKKK